jgi:transcriptional regulator with XRE-family HTH domain
MKVVVLDDAGQVIELPALTEVPDWLRKVRAANSLSMQALGDMLGVTKQAIYSWEKGVASPTQENLAKLVSAFKMEKAEPKAKKSKMDAINDLLKPHAKNVTG